MLDNIIDNRGLSSIVAYLIKIHKHFTGRRHYRDNGNIASKFM